MHKSTFSIRGSVLALSMTVIAGVPAISVAGPGCMNDQRMSRGYYSPNYMPPQAGYGMRAPYSRHPAAAMQPRWMAPPYQRPVTARSVAPVPVSSPGTQVLPQANAVQPDLTAVGTDSTPATETVTVRISGMRFEPANLTVKPGTTVKWVQSDRMPHTVTGKGNGLRSNTLQSGQAYSFTFNETGRHDYACDFHPSMQGVVVVEENGAGV